MSVILKDNRKVFVNNSGGGSDPSLNSRVTILEDNEYKIAYFTEISNTTGTITIPTGGTILLDQLQGGVDAYISTIENGQPTGILPETSTGVKVDVSSFDALGNYTLSGTPSSYPVAIIYLLKIKAKDYSNLTLSNIIEIYDNNIEVYSYQPVISNLWRTIPFTGNAGSLANTTGIMLFIPYIVDEDHYVTEIGLYLLAGTAGGNIRLALYSKDPTTGQALTLIEDSGNIAATSSGQKSFVFSSPHLLKASEKVYYMGYQADANAISARSSSTWLTNIYDGPTGISNCRIQFSAYAAFPATVSPSSQTGNAILVSLKPQ